MTADNHAAAICSNLFARAVAEAPADQLGLYQLQGAMVRLRREDLGIIQSELATLAGISQQTVSRVELGTSRASDEVRVAIAAALQLPSGGLFPYADEMGVTR